MTAATVEADPQSLAIDAAGIAEASLKVGTRNDGMRAYITAIRAVPIGPQPVIIHGERSGEFDPLAKHDSFRGALAGARQAAAEMAGHLDTLHQWAAGGAKSIASGVTVPLQRALDLAQGDAITSEQSREIVTQMGLAWVHTMMIAGSLQGLSRGVTDFLNRIVQDYETLTRGPLELRHVADDVRRNIAADAQPLLVNPITAGIGKTYLDIGAAFLVTIDRLAGAIGRATEAHETMRVGASALGVALASARGKYQAACEAAGRASPAELPAVIRRYGLNTAITSWNQFADFFTRSGL